MILSSGNISSLSDEEIAARYRKDGRKKWVGVLFKRYVHLALGVCLKYLKNREEAEEATSAIFEKLMETLKSHEVENFRGWFHTVVRNHCLMKLRKHKHQMVELDEIPLADEQFPDLAAMKEENYRKLEAAIAELKPEQEKCIRLFYLNGTSYKQIEAVSKFTLKEIKSHIQNGKRNLKAILERDEEFISGRENH